MANATKKLIAQALLDLLSSKTLDKITVKEIVEKSGVNRQTFYYNFEDIYALVEWIFEEKASDIVNESQNFASWQEIFFAAFRLLQENRPLVLNTYHSLNRVHLERYLKNWLHPKAAAFVEEKARGYAVGEREKDFIVSCYVAIFVGIALEWVEGNMTRGYEDQISLFLRLIDGSLESTLEKFSEPENGPKKVEEKLPL